MWCVCVTTLYIIKHLWYVRYATVLCLEKEMEIPVCITAVTNPGRLGDWNQDWVLCPLPEWGSFLRTIGKNLLLIGEGGGRCFVRFHKHRRCDLGCVSFLYLNV